MTIYSEPFLLPALVTEKKTFLARQYGQTGGQSFGLNMRQWNLNGGEIRL
jgi:hypothetical protein